MYNSFTTTFKIIRSLTAILLHLGYTHYLPMLKHDDFTPWLHLYYLTML
eukprot:UN09947